MAKSKVSSASPKRSATARTTRVLIVDDHELLRYGLRLMIDNDPHLEVCGEAADERQAVAEVRRTHPDVVLVDLALKKGDGVALIKRIKKIDSTIRIIVSTMHEERIYGERVLRAGATGYVNKQSPAGTILKAIRRVLEGKMCFSDELTQRVLRRASEPEPLSGRSPLTALSDRELEVFRLVGQGLATRAIADQLNLSPRTVDTYRERLKSKLQLKTSVELSHHAIRWALEPAASGETAPPPRKRRK